MKPIFQPIKVIVLASSLFISSAVSAREAISLKTGWKFSKGNVENAAKIDFDDSKWQSITLPHDWAISGPFIMEGNGNTGKLPWKGEGWYRKSLDIPKAYTGKRIYLVFDGIMAFPQIFINGKLAGKWDYGYNSFYLDATDFLKAGEKNVLAIYVDTRMHDSRWYPGAGIYRKIQMVVTDELHVGVWGTYITTPVVKSHYAQVRVMNTVVNKSSIDLDKVKVENIIVAPNGNEIARKEISGKVNANSSRDLELTLELTNPQRWDIDNPVLYKVKTIVRNGDQITDEYFTSFGVRTIRVTPDDGFYLNDRRVQLKGVNLHHDQGPLGAAFYERAMERQIEIMKSMGCNAIRTSHNAAAPELLDLCDRMGILVFDEIFDKYDQKADILENTDFEEFAHRNIKNFVTRDRNHPSIFIWSVGNEIVDVQTNKNNGLQKLNSMVTYVRKYNSTRPVTMVADYRDSAVYRHFDLYDVHCWNYGRKYELARQMEPNKMVIISESAGVVSTRGFYELPLPLKRTDFTKSLQASSYDLNAPFWAEIPDDDFMWQQDENYIAGEFVWSGFDYLGEPYPYENNTLKEMGMTDRDASYSSYFGIVDLCGFPKDRYYLYKSLWKQDESTVHILPHWNWEGKEGQNFPVFVYTNGDAVELFLNGKSLGKKSKKPNSKKSTDRFRLMWPEVIYQPGELKAVAYKEGQIIGESKMNTAGKPEKVNISIDRKTIRSGGDDLAYIAIEALDKNGNPCPLADNQLLLELKGQGFIAGVGNGNPQSFEPFQGNRIRLFNGKALVIVGSGSEKGKVDLQVKSDGLPTSSIQIIVE